ncbi:MAG: GAF domain-containing protein [Chloroflexi bacterium]|nr:GAF domain-containing protein [Chloroflexota bacterium]
MARVNLKRLVLKKDDLAHAIIALGQTVDSTLAIQDAEGEFVIGALSAAAEKHGIEIEGETIGWVHGGKPSKSVAALLAKVAARESEKKALANEALGLYREINLLYNLSDKLAASRELAAVAQLVLTQAAGAIKATEGSVMLLDEETQVIKSAATVGDPEAVSGRLACVRGIVEYVAQSGKAEIVNEVRLDSRYVDCDGAVNALVCAPLKAKQQVIGVIVLLSAPAVAYAAADLKLLDTLASQAGPAIESAIFYEKTLREAQEREARLQRQIDQLRIELDEALLSKQVEEITESDYFQRLRQQAEDLRRTMGDAG